MKRMSNLVFLIVVLTIAIMFNCSAKELEPGLIQRTPENSSLIDSALEYNSERYNSHAWEVLKEKKDKLEEEKKALVVNSYEEDLIKTKEFAIRHHLMLYEAYRDIIKEIPNSKFKDDYIRDMNIQKKYLAQMGVAIIEDINVDSNTNNYTNPGVEVQSENGKSAVIWSVK